MGASLATALMDAGAWPARLTKVRANANLEGRGFLRELVSRLTRAQTPRDAERMKRVNLLGRVLAICLCSGFVVACYVRAESGPPVEECRNTVRRTSDVEVCRTHCNDNGCRERCSEQERWSREHHCWVE